MKNNKNIFLVVGLFALTFSTQPAHCMQDTQHKRPQRTEDDDLELPKYSKQEISWQNIALSFYTGAQLHFINEKELSRWRTITKQESIGISKLSRDFWAQDTNMQDLQNAKKYKLTRADDEAIYLVCDATPVKLWHRHPYEIPSLDSLIFGEFYLTHEWSELLGKTFYVAEKYDATLETPFTLKLKLKK